MVKKIRRLACCAALALTALLSGCGDSMNGVVPEQFVPWYFGLIQRSIDLSEYLVFEYRDKPLYIRALSGPRTDDPVNQETTWVVLFQERNPEANLVLVFDAGYQLRYATTSIQAYASHWFVDLTGTLVIGGLRLSPPAQPGGAWLEDSVPDNLRQVGKSPAYVLPATTALTSRIYRMDLIVETATGNLLFGEYPSSPILRYLNGNHLETMNSGGQLCIPNFASTRYGQLFPGATWQPGSELVVYCHGLDVDRGEGTARAFCSLRDNANNRESPLFILSFARVALEAGPTVSFTLLDSGTQLWYSTDSHSGKGFDPSRNQIVRLADGSLLASMPQISDLNVDGVTALKPLVHLKADGSLIKRIEVPLPRYQTSNGSSLESEMSSISQTPFLIPRAADWLVVDGYTQRLYVCAPWWE